MRGRGLRAISLELRADLRSRNKLVARGSWLMALLVSVTTLSSQEVHIPLNEGWSFRQVGTEQWYPAQVPGVVQQDLLRNGLIPDPMHDANADSVQWIELKDWEYVRMIQVDTGLLAHSNVNLEFKGLDTFAEVFLNDSVVLQADNMFQERTSLDIKPRLKLGLNELHVVFHSPIKEGARSRVAYGIQLPHDGDPSGVSPYVRKAAYQFGWDFGPRLVNMGIWQPVSLSAWGQATGLSTMLDEEWRGNDLIMKLYPHFISEPYQGPDCRLVALWDGREVAHTSSRGYAAEHPVLEFKVRRPERWWPSGEGDQALHKLRLELRHGKELLASWERPYGIRQMELDQHHDTVGASFRFLVNGIPVFMKGCNLIPPTMTPTAANDSLWMHLVKDLQRTGMNMVRVWAGGVYPPDAFFDACDTAGILVWQDLMFANMTPYGEEDDRRITGEMIHQLNRLADHPSLVLWCGNNELDVAWRNWGWQDRYGLHGADSARVIADHDTLFRGLQTVWTMRAMGQNYTPTSPLSNWGNAEGLKNGDLHYWGVWHGDSAFSSFKNNVGRFVSEYGFQSYPDSATLATQLDPEHLYLGSPMLAARQKSYKTDKPIWTAIDREFAVKPRYLGEFILFSQLAQAEAYRQAIWAHVTGQPHCMGTLFWQLNDVWAGPSWSTVDHTGTWKAAMYEVARSYKPVVLDLELVNSKFTATLWNERTDLKAAKVVTQVFRTDGQRISSDTNSVLLGTGKSVLISAGQEALLKGGGADRHVVRVAVLDERGEVLVERILPFKRMGEMAWEKAEVRLERVGRAEGSATYRLSTDKPVPLVKLTLTGTEFSDNYFPLVPGQDRLVTVSRRSGSQGEPELLVWP